MGEVHAQDPVAGLEHREVGGHVGLGARVGLDVDVVRAREQGERRGCDVDVAFCPERIAEGHALEELRSLPQIIGADEPGAGDRAEQLFHVIASKTVRTTSKEAELAKLFTNTWRYMKFAVANQFFMIADQAGVDYTNILRAIREDYPRAQDLPGPGFAAGPCLFKDTMQLSAFTSDHFPMGQAAMQVNEGLPAYIVSALQRRYGGLERKTVGILGMAFKAESDDTRASLSYKLRKLLAWAGARVLCTDPFVDDPASYRSVECIDGERRPRPRGSPQGVPRDARRRQGRGRRVERAGRRDPALVKVLVTGSAGFINGYLVQELLDRGPHGHRARRLQQVRPAPRRATTGTRATRSSRATPRTAR